MRGSIASVFLCVIAAVACSQSPPPPEPGPEDAVLTDITALSGLGGSGAAWEDGTFFLPEIMQGGVAVFDYDADGDLDILHARVPPPGSPDAPAPNVLYERQDDGTYRDVTEKAGIGDPGFGQGFAVGDADNDGDLDVYTTNFGADAFYRNNGDGTFVNDTKRSGFSGERWSTSAAFLDYDRDGHLDLFVLHYLQFDPDTACQDASGRREYCSPQTFPGEHDRLYRNNGDGTFRDVTEAAGLIPADGGQKAKGLGLVCADLTGDGLVDVYVANDQESNHLWINRGDGTFDEEGILRGVAVNQYGKAEASMGVTVGDVNGDGSPDLYMTHLAKEHNTLYTGRDDVLFSDGTLESKLGLYDLPYTGFGCAFVDIDLDGDLDVAVANGRVTRGEDAGNPALSAFWNLYAEPNLLFENDGGGTFAPLAGGGSFTTVSEVSRGLALGDLDDDGDLDLVLSNVDNTLRIFRNDAPAAGTHWLAVRPIVGRRTALGARVTVRTGDREQSAFALAAYSYASSGDPRVHFGLGSADRVDRIEVLWPDGARELFDAPQVDTAIEVVRGQGKKP